MAGADLAAATTAPPQRITRTSDALRSLPALDHALSTGALTLDQVAAAAEFATPGTDAELARVAVGKAPSADRARRAHARPARRSTDDQALYERRALSMTWTRGRRELVLQRPPAARTGRRLRAGHLEHRQAPARARQAGRHDPRLAAVRRRRARHARPAGGGADGGVRRSPTTLIVHLSDDAPPLLEGAGPISPETAERLACDARRLTIKPQRPRPRALARRTLRLLRPAARAAQTLSGHCQYPGCTATRELEAHHLIAVEHGGTTELDNLILLCPRHHKLLHDHHIRTSGNAEHPAFTDEAGRAITTNQPHAPPR